MEGLAVRPVPGKGRGVFAERDFAEGELIERCPVILIPQRHQVLYSATMLADYGFRWGRSHRFVAMPLGYGCIYNHSPEPNAKFLVRSDGQSVNFLCVRPISAGEEITHHYGWARPKSPPWYVDYSDRSAAFRNRRFVSSGVAVAVVGVGAISVCAAAAGGVIALTRAARRLGRRFRSGALSQLGTTSSKR